MAFDLAEFKKLPVVDRLERVIDAEMIVAINRSRHIFHVRELAHAAGCLEIDVIDLVPKVLAKRYVAWNVSFPQLSSVIVFERNR